MEQGNRIKIYQRIREFTRNMKRENLSTFASAAAFFLFLSMVPILIVICTILPYTPITEEKLLLLVMDIFPDKVDTIMMNMIDDVYERSAGVLSVAVLVTLWSAGKGVLAVIRGLNAVNDVEEHRNYFLVRLVSSFYTLIMLLVILISMILLVFGNILVDMLVSRLPALESIISFFMNFRFMMIWLILTMVFCAFYAYLPDKKLRFREQIYGASFAAVIWIVFSWGFSIYVEYGKLVSIYGSLHIITILLLWLYFGFYIIFIGAFINKHFLVQEEF